MRQGAELERACDAEIQPVGKHSIQGLRDIVICWRSQARASRHAGFDAKCYPKCYPEYRLRPQYRLIRTSAGKARRR
jgi:hypothetical protein